MKKDMRRDRRIKMNEQQENKLIEILGSIDDSLKLITKKMTKVM